MDAMTKPSCTKCGTTMEDGFLYGNDARGGTVTPSEWVEGAPKRSIWTGISTRGREHHAVVTYRCPKCGFIESYAPAE
jgi:predicted RNA-binding Zn-ribbon protein involved in translation (DUF1610 family)